MDGMVRLVVHEHVHAPQDAARLVWLESHSFESRSGLPSEPQMASRAFYVALALCIGLWVELFRWVFSMVDYLLKCVWHWLENQFYRMLFKIWPPEYGPGDPETPPSPYTPYSENDDTWSDDDWWSS